MRPAHLGGTSGPVHSPQLNVTLASDTSATTEAAWSRGIGIQSPPERLIPSTSYRRSLDLVSSWCEAVITLISSGIAFPPRANFVSTVTSPRGVRALGARRRQEPEQPHQAPRNQPETGATPKSLPLRGSASPGLLKSPRCFPTCQGSHLLLGASTRLWGKGVAGRERPEAGAPQMHRRI